MVADAGMLSAANLKALDQAGHTFILGSKTTKAPIDLASHFRWHGDVFTDGQVIDTLTPNVLRQGSCRISGFESDHTVGVWLTRE